jgi:hypothetical protein
MDEHMQNWLKISFPASNLSFHGPKCQIFAGFSVFCQKLVPNEHFL